MNERKLNSLNDIFLDGSSVCRCVAKKETFIQRIKCFLKTFEGECFTNEGLGMPWLKDFLGNDNVSIHHMQKIIKDKIEELEGVSEVLESEVIFNDRKISGKIKVKFNTNEVESVSL